MSTSWQWVKANPDEAARQIRQLERENESLLEQVRGLEPMVDRLERENAALRSQATVPEETITRLRCTIKAAMHVEGQLQAENAALRSLLREAITEHVDPYDLPEGDDYIARVKTALGECQP